MAASIIFFLLSVTINIVILLVFKKLDDDKKSLSKVARYCQKFKEDIDNDYNEKMTKIKDFNTCLDTSLQKGGRILNQLSNITSAYDSDSGKMSVSPELLKRISNMESKLSEMEDKSYSPSAVKMSGSGTGGRELFSQLSGLRKEVSAMMKELEKKKKEANDSYRLFDSRMKSEMEAKKNNILEFIKLQENQFNENEKKFQKELDRIDSDIAKMNKNFIKDASQNFTLLNQDYRMKFEDLSKKYADMDAEYSKKLETKIKDCSEYITRIEGRCTSLEEQIIKELEKAKEEYILDLAAKFTTEKSDISKFGEQLKTNAKAYILKTIKDNEEKSKSISETFKKNEMQAQVTLKRYEDFLKDSAERLESSKNEFINSLEQKVADFNSHLDTSKQMGIKLELEIFTEIKTKLETFRRESEKNIDALRNKLDSDIANYDKQISSKYSSIKEDYSKAALDYNELTTKYEKFTDTFSKTVESNRKALEDQENAVNEKAAALKKAIETGLVKWNETFNAEKQRIEDLFETDKKALDEKRDKAADEMTETIAEYESMMNQSVENVKVHFEEQRSKIFAEIDSIVAQIESNAAGKTGEISSKFDKTYSDFENKLSDIQDNMLQKASDIEQMLLAKSDEINAHLVEEMDTFKKSVSDRSTQFESEINQENEAIIVRVNTFKDDVQKMIDDEKAQVGQDIAAMKSDFSTAETAINDKLHNIETLYYDKGVQLLETNKTELSGYSQRFEQLSGNINELQKTIEDKLYNLVSDGTKQIDDLFEQGKASLTEKYNALSAETSKQIDEHKNDLTKIRKTISELDTTYDTKFNDKIDMFTTQFGTKLDKFNEEFKLNISQITEDAKK
ncbi:MAG: hypothetical protein II707_05010, partial [Spirochaetales bacterium]|nr:hypothetical protein [Spirochaetales bacterium]